MEIDRTKFVESLDEYALHVFTDGSAYQKPRRGGVGALLVWFDSSGNDSVYELDLPGYSGPTNNQMELQACLEALKLLNSPQRPVSLSRYTRIIIHADSLYVVDNWMSALFTWPRRRWVNRHGAPLANAELWKEIGRQVSKTGKRVEARWVKGHAKSLYNKTADRLAKASAAKRTAKRISVVNVRRKLSSKNVQIGSVKVSGQRLTIRIIQDQYLKIQKVYRYMFEVVSRASPFYRNIDIIFSDISLRAGHTYSVRLNSNPKNPRIEKIYKEVIM